MVDDDVIYGMIQPHVSRNEAKMTCNLHRYIRSGDIPRAKSLIENLSFEERRKLTNSIQELGLKPVIFVAIERRNKNLVEFLVNECDADVNEEALCTLKRDVSVPENETGPREMSPLEFAILSGMWECAEFLLSVGADVKKSAKNKYVLLKSCKAGAHQIAKLLLDRGADVNVSDHNGNTCLMKATWFVGLCRFLIDRGAELNRKNTDGETALHIAVSGDEYDCVSLLLQRGADPFTINNEGDDALRLASLNGFNSKVKSLLTGVVKDVKREIESCQLQGVRLVQNNLIADALLKWEFAITLALENQIETIAAKYETPFGMAVEATSLSEIENMRRNLEDVKMQCIVLTHKHLGPLHSMFQHAILSCYCRYVDTNSFEKCWQLLTYYVQITLSSTPQLPKRYRRLQTILNEAERYISKLCNMAVKPSITFATVYECMVTVTQEIEKCLEPREENIIAKLILNVIFLFSLVDCDTMQKLNFKTVVHTAIKANPKSGKVKTILLDTIHQIFGFTRRVFQQSVIMSASPLNVISILIECGFDLNERDDDGNNAANLLVTQFISNDRHVADDFRVIAAKMIEYGVHLDARNHRGMATTAYLQELGIRMAFPVNLMCLSAKAVRRFNFSLESLERLLPKFLFDFVKMH